VLIADDSAVSLSASFPADTPAALQIVLQQLPNRLVASFRISAESRLAEAKARTFTGARQLIAASLLRQADTALTAGDSAADPVAKLNAYYRVWLLSGMVLSL
jgi:hypothetical protein